MSTPSSATANFDAVAFVTNYLAAIEQGATGDALAAFFTPDVVQYEFPNRLVPNGAQRDLEAILAGANRGQQVTSTQQYKLLNMVTSGAQAAVEVQWSATLTVPVGSLPAGGQMRARFAFFLEFRDGRIAVQRNYDCFDPW